MKMYKVAQKDEDFQKLYNCNDKHSVSNDHDNKLAQYYKR